MIAIIGILVGLLLPAVQAARESARVAQCMNHVKQLALATHAHHDAQGFFPSGGWGFGWVGDPDLGFGAKQPGSWAFSALPYLEQGNLASLGAGGSDAVKAQAVRTISTTPLSMFVCPSRRAVRLYPIRQTDDAGAFVAFFYNNPGVGTARATRPPAAAKSCYAMNSGNAWPQFVAGPTTLAAAATYPDWNLYVPLGNAVGITWWRSQFSFAHVRDGASNTLLIGEKSLNPTLYEAWDGGGDASTMHEGHDLEANRYAGTAHPLKQDRAGVSDTYSFGGPHPAGGVFAFCDGSVRTVAFSIDLTLYANLAHRNDGQVLNGNF